MSIGEYCRIYRIPWAKVQPLAGIFTDMETGNLIWNLDYDMLVSDAEWQWFLREWYPWI